jgi:hypothetical protein
VLRCTAAAVTIRISNPRHGLLSFLNYCLQMTMMMMMMIITIIITTTTAIIYATTSYT